MSNAFLSFKFPVVLLHIVTVLFAVPLTAIVINNKFSVIISGITNATQAPWESPKNRKCVQLIGHAGN